MKNSKRLPAVMLALVLLLSAVPGAAFALDWYEPATWSDIDKIDDLCKEHSFSGWRTGQAPTCMNSGWQSRKCSKCGMEEIMFLPPSSHSFSVWEFTTESTDHSAGVMKRTCSVCGSSETKTFYPDGTLKLYSQGAAVLQLQKALHDLGYLSGRFVDGDYGAFTEAAVMRFQEKNGLTADGIAWPQTLKLLVG